MSVDRTRLRSQQQPISYATKTDVIPMCYRTGESSGKNYEYTLIVNSEQD